jgi:hypothetical protein
VKPWEKNYKVADEAPTKPKPWEKKWTLDPEEEKRNIRRGLNPDGTPLRPGAGQGERGVTVPWYKERKTQGTLEQQERAFSEEHGIVGPVVDNLKRSWANSKAGVKSGLEMPALERGAEAKSGQPLTLNDPFMSSSYGGVNPIYAEQMMQGEELARHRENVASGGVEAAKNLAKIAAEQQQATKGLETRPSTAAALAPGATWGERFDALATNPVGVIGDLTAQSAVQIAPAVAVGIATKSPVISAMAAGVFGGGAEYGAGVVDYLANTGVDVSDESAIEQALADPKTVQAAISHAEKRAAIIGAASAVSQQVAGKMLVPAGLASKAATALPGVSRVVSKVGGKEAANTLVAQPIAGAVVDAGGEAAAGAATTGVSAADVFAEAVGGVGTQPIEAAAFTYQRVQEAKAERLKAERVVASTPEEAGTLDTGIALAEARAKKAEQATTWRQRKAEREAAAEPIRTNSPENAEIERTDVETEELRRMLADAGMSSDEQIEGDIMQPPELAPLNTDSVEQNVSQDTILPSQTDDDAPNFGMPEPSRALPDDSPLLVPRDKDASPERVALRNELVAQRFTGKEPVPQGQKPVAIVMGGGGASGKGTVLKMLHRTGSIPSGAVELDPDSFKTGNQKDGLSGIPEYWDIVNSGDSRAAGVVHEESSNLYKQALADGIKGRYDLVLDRTMSDPAKGVKELQALKDAGYEVRMVGVTVNPDEAVGRAVKRAQGPEKRFVPVNALLSAHKGFSNAFEQYLPYVDNAVLYDNSVPRDAPPVMIAEGGNGALSVADQARYNNFRRKGEINESATTRSQLGAVAYGQAEAGNAGRLESGEGRARQRPGTTAEAGSSATANATLNLPSRAVNPDDGGGPEVMTFEAFAAKHGASRSDFGDAGAHKRGRNQSNKQWNRIVKFLGQRSALVAEKRDSLRAEFEAAKEAGLIREPTRIERLQAAAAGHPDNPSVQAAKRLLEGYAAKTGADGSVMPARDEGSEKRPYYVAKKAKQAVSVAAIRDTITRTYGRRARKLLESGRTKIVQSERDVSAEIRSRSEPLQSADGTIQGFYDQKTGDSYLIADNFKRIEDVAPVFLHEEGVHAGMKAILGEKFDAIAKRLSDIAENGNATDKAIVQKAKRRAEKAGGPASTFNEEWIAYTVQLAEQAKQSENPPTHVLRRWLNSVYQAISAWAARNGFKNVSVDDLRQIARGALGHQARIEQKGAAVQPSRTVDEKPIEEMLDESGELKALKKQDKYREAADERVNDARDTARDKRAEARSSLGVTGPSVTWGLDADRFNDSLKGAFNRLRENLQDKYISVLGAQKDIEKVTGQLIAESMNVWRRENLMHGRVSDQIKKLNDTYVKPIKDLMKRSKVTSEQVEDFLEARAAEDRNKRIAQINPSMPDGGAGIKTADAKAFLDGTAEGYRSKEKLTPELRGKVEDVVSKLDSVRDETLRRLRDSGQITPSQYRELSKNRTYAPLRGKEGGEEIGGGFGTGGGVDVRGKPFQRAMGRGEGNRAVNIIAEILGDAESSIVQAEKTRVGQTLLRLVLANPNKDVWEVEPVKIERKYSESQDIVYDAIAAVDNDPGAVRVMVDGKPYRLVLKDERMAKAVKNLGAEQLGFVIRMMAAVNRYFSAILTRYNPSFVPINMIRDLGMGIIGVTSEHGLKAGVDALKNYTPAMRALWREARGKAPVNQAGQYAREFSEAGGRTGFHSYQNVEEMAQQFKDELKSIGSIIRDKDATALSRLARTYRKGAIAIKDSAIIQVIEDANDTVENSMRLAAFIARRKGGASVEAAAEYAKNVTVNFNRRGHGTSMANAIFLFFNAATQGSTRTFQLLKQPKVMGSMVALGSLQYVLAALAMGVDDEDEDGLTAWEKISDYEKERNLIFPLVGEENGRMKVKLVKVPMPYGFNFFPYLGGRLAQAIHGREESDPTKLANDVGSAAIDAVSPVKFTGGTRGYIPHLANIFVTLGYNKDDFGSRITDENPYNKFPEPRASLGRASTPEIYHKAATALNRLGGGDEVTPPKIMANLLDWSPEDLKYLTEAFTGGIGRTANQTVSLGQKAYAGVDVSTGDIPVLKALVSNVDMERSTQNTYYDRKEAIARESARVRIIYKNQGREAALEHLKNTPELSGVSLHRFKSTGKYEDKEGSIQLDAKKGGLYEAVKKADKSVSDISDRMKAVRVSDLSLAEKTRQIDALEKERETAQRKLNTTWRERRAARQ